MCVAPQRRALFRHLNLQKWSDNGVFCTFWLRNVLRAATASTFSTSQLPKVVRAWCALYIFTSKCASRHNGVHFFDIATSNFQKLSDHGVLCTFWLGNVLCATTACNFSSLVWPDGSAPAALASLLFDPPEPQIIGKTQCFATFLPFRASASSFFWLFLFSDLLSSNSSNLSLLSASALLCFSSVHVVGSLTSKLPSNIGRIIYIYIYIVYIYTCSEVFEISGCIKSKWIFLNEIPHGKILQSTKPCCVGVCVSVRVLKRTSANASCLICLQATQQG